MSKQRNNAGFTIIELLIATIVFSIVLLTIAAAITQIGRLYYKGITSSRTQETTRSIMRSMAETIQFSPGQVTSTTSNVLDGANGSKALCVATKHYSYILGRQESTNSHAFVENEIPSGCTATLAQDLTAGGVQGRELLGDKMRLANLEVVQQGTSDVYKLTVRVVYGDTDLVCSPSVTDTTSSANCRSTSSMTEAQIANIRDLSCKNIRSGTQFCAASELSTIVKRRLTDD